MLDDALPDPHAVRERCLAKTDWEYGFPVTGATWPDMRAMPALREDEPAGVEARVREAAGAQTLWVSQAAAGQKLNHNCVQVVGAVEGAVKPHTDSLDLCRYAAVLYLNPQVPYSCGTSFFRQRLDGGRLGGNMVLPPHRNLVDALGNRFVQPNAFARDVCVPHRFNRLLLYKANIIPSASAYWGLEDAASKRMTAVFFWMT